MIRILLKSVREYKKASIAAPLFVSAEVVLECVIPFILAKLVNELKAGCNFSVLATYGAVLIVLAVMSLFFGIMSGRAAAAASCGMGCNLRKDMFYAVQKFSFENIDKFSSSSLVTRMTTDVTNVQNAYMMLIRTVVRSPLIFIFAFVMAFVMGGSMAWIYLIVAPILGACLVAVACITVPLFRRIFRKYDKLNVTVQENVNGMRVVKSFVREEYETQKFDSATGEVCRDFTKAERILALNNPIMPFCLYVVTVFVLSFGAYKIISTSGAALDVGQFSALLTYSFMILNSLMMLSMVFVMVTMAGESAKRIVEVLTEESTLKNPENACTTVENGSIEFDNVSFKYSAAAEKKSLYDVSFSISSGQTVGIVGGTGSSKSTLVSLISRLYDATDGTVKVGGKDVREYDLAMLRDQVAVVLQKNVLFSGSVKENLRWGNKDATDEQLIEACKLAQAHDFVSAFPDGYDTYIEQGGTNVSGGQNQRLCIARALLKRPKILIMDDSTSAVDTKTDALIRRAMSEYMPEMTKIIIAQRVASVENSDKILVMEGGSLSAMGTNEELLKTSDIYREMVTSQNKAGTENA